MDLGFRGTNLDKQDFDLVYPVILSKNIPVSADLPLNFTKSLEVRECHLRSSAFIPPARDKSADKIFGSKHWKGRYLFGKKVIL
jgi:hypothetical protein